MSAYWAAPWLKIYGDAKDVVLGVESAGNLDLRLRAVR